ncbi:hypothetical protein A8950_3809 [Dongia mobilis]|uniref:Uncharacterized protein n=1 Tax=Dongia mobilis TaxID=578943 RepID=A0A4R6WJ08_9PROT|nr:hypothetical protein [Dongia mobilis]TDQ77654.1 hypothetical protein A8950_3809 [Dongia mobilis]
MNTVAEIAGAEASAMAEYKGILQRLLDNRPSGTRQRLALALGKNRSFVSQITNASYAVPIPAPHIETIFEIVHFPPLERQAFLAAYDRAHPGRLQRSQTGRRIRTATLHVPDLGSEERNRRLDQMLTDVAVQMARIIEDEK